ncbi:MAG: DUF4352 domain-containing protein [Christensenellaceae bacterium]|jgi:hypothetical protein|nr:DUF4352 domain-containing protein [Christensenellaceae bacterium]
MRNSKCGAWALVLSIAGFLTAFLGGIGVFFDVAAIILAIIAFARAKKTGKFTFALIATILAGISLVVYFIVLSGLRAVSSALNEAGNDVAVVTNQTTSTPESVSQAAPALAEGNAMVQEETAVYGVGDTIVNGDLEITVAAIEVYEHDSRFLQPKEGYIYIRVDLAAANTSASKVSSVYGGASFTAYADDEAVEQKYLSADDSKSFSGEIAPGKRLSGSIFYEVPKGLRAFELQYAPDMFSRSKRVSIVKTF